MPKQIKQRPARRYQPKERAVQFRADRDVLVERMPAPDQQPKLGPYEFRYSVEHGYAAQSRFA